MEGSPPKPWWDYTAGRKRRYPDVSLKHSTPSHA
jgi:hypothetical protein